MESQIQHEWDAIRGARGYGNSWQNWILSFEIIQAVPTACPDDASILDDMLQITEHDCNSQCQLESQRRQQAKKIKFEVDEKHDFLRFSYKIAKAKSQQSFEEVPVTLQCQASLLRTRNHQAALRLHTHVEFRPHVPISFGDAKLRIVSQDHLVVHFQVISGIVPCSDTLTQTSYILDSQGITQEFNRFWSPFWNRDEYDSQF